MSQFSSVIRNLSREVLSGSGKGLVILIGLAFSVVLIAKVIDRPEIHGGDSEISTGVPATAGNETIVVVSEQPSEGVTESDMDAEFLSRYMVWHRSTFEKKYRASLGSAFGADAQVFFESLRSEGVYAYLPTTDGRSKKLLIVRTRSPRAELQIVEAIGLVGGNVVRVGCVRRHGEVLITQGKCGTAMSSLLEIRASDHEQ